LEHEQCSGLSQRLIFAVELNSKLFDALVRRRVRDLRLRFGLGAQRSEHVALSLIEVRLVDALTPQEGAKILICEAAGLHQQTQLVFGRAVKGTSRGG
jgi:hypothetical protein